MSTRIGEVQLRHTVSRLSMSEMALAVLRRLVATQPRARWLLLAPGFQLQWSFERSVWEKAAGEKAFRRVLERLAGVPVPGITPAAKKEARKVRSPSCSPHAHATRAARGIKKKKKGIGLFPLEPRS
jgi:hypothetical protein